MSEFIKIEKDGETIEVHPDALAEHIGRLGWKLVPTDAPAPVAVEIAAPEKPAPAKGKGKGKS